MSRPCPQRQVWNFSVLSACKPQQWRASLKLDGRRHASSASNSVLGLRHLQIPGVTCARLRFSKSYHIIGAHNVWAVDLEAHVKYHQIERDKQLCQSLNLHNTPAGLWSRISANVIANNFSAVPRNWASRRLKRLIQKQLAELGYDPQGRCLTNLWPPLSTNPFRIPGMRHSNMLPFGQHDLRGSIEILLHKEAVTATSVVIDKQAKLLAQRIVSLCQPPSAEHGARASGRDFSRQRWETRRADD